jgi:hypothetical protein
VTRILD